jgi:hypothetical protein
VVEFISEGVQTEKVEEPPPEAEEPQISVVQESLELLVQAHTEELREAADRIYIDEPSSPQGDYYQPSDIQLADAPDLQHQIKPLVYDENDIPVVVDIFELYSRKEIGDDKWWKKNWLL